jgi:hypothetical protein
MPPSGGLVKRKNRAACQPTPAIFPQNLSVPSASSYFRIETINFRKGGKEYMTEITQILQKSQARNSWQILPVRFCAKAGNVDKNNSCSWQGAEG